LAEAALRALLYSDLFDQPLTPDELHRYLPIKTAPGPLLAAVGPGSASAGPVNQSDGLYCLAGREAILAIRHRREQVARERWPRRGATVGRSRRCPSSAWSR